MKNIITVNKIIEEFIAYLRASSKELINSPSKLQIGIFIILFITNIALSIRNYHSFQLGIYIDESSYVVLSQSIAFSDDYGLINFPGQSQSTRYPFGFPLLLTPFAWLFPQSPSMMKFASLLATLLIISLLFWGWPYLSQNKSYWWGLIIVALYSSSPIVIGHTRMVMSEPAFTTFALGSLILTERCLRNSCKNTAHILLLGFMTIFTFFIRTIGITLCVAVIIRILLAFPFSHAIKTLGYLLLGGMVFVIIVFVLTPIAIHDLLPFEYADQFENPQSWDQIQVETALIPRIYTGFLAYTKQHLREVVLPIGGGNQELEFGKRMGITDLPLLTGLVFGSLILLGSFSFLLKQGLSPSVYIFEILYFSAILLWPWRSARFLYPILPFLLYNLLWGVSIIGNQFRRIKILPKRISPITSETGVAVFFLVILFISIYKGVTDNNNSLQYTRDLRVGTTWLKENSSSEALIMAQEPESIFLYSQRKTIDYIYASTVPELERKIHQQGIDYILVAPKLEWNTDGSLEYDVYTRNIFLPHIDELVSRGYLRLVYQSDEDMVQAFQVLE